MAEGMGGGGADPRVEAAPAVLDLRDETAASVRPERFGLSAVTAVDYEVEVVDDALVALRTAIGARRALVVTTPTVARLYGDRLRAGLGALGDAVRIVVLEVDERSKEIETALDVCRAALDHGIGRRDVLVAVGGGVCCDLVTVAATLVRRGVPYVCVPTTLVGQIDAGIGLKGGVNFAGRKSYLGSFTAPERVLVEPALLRTLPTALVAAGAAEMAKMGLVVDGELFGLLARDGASLVRSGFAAPAGVGRRAIARSIELMLAELEPNCFEDRTFERLVDFGHTFSPELEARSGFRMAHGEAVAIDMALAAAIAVELDRLPVQDLDLICATFTALSLPTWSPWLSVDLVEVALAAACAHRDGVANLVIPTAIGAGAFVPDSATVLAVAGDALTRLAARSVDDVLVAGAEPRAR